MFMFIFNFIFTIWLYFLVLMIVLAVAYILLEWRCEIHYISDLYERAVLWRVAACYSIIYFIVCIFI